MDVADRLRKRNAPYGTNELMDTAADHIERLRKALVPFIAAHPEPIEGTRSASIIVTIDELRAAAAVLTQTTS